MRESDHRDASLPLGTACRSMASGCRACIAQTEGISSPHSVQRGTVCPSTAGLIRRGPRSQRRHHGDVSTSPTTTVRLSDTPTLGKLPIH
jgi:hypothetical protein